MENEVDNMNPLLVVDNLSNGFDLEKDKDENNSQSISQSEEILLTLIAEIIVEIILKEGI